MQKAEKERITEELENSKTGIAIDNVYRRWSVLVSRRRYTALLHFCFHSKFVCLFFFFLIWNNNNKNCANYLVKLYT